MSKIQFELTREGASALAAQQSRLIEPLPRTISPDVRWVRNTVTGYIELCNDLMRPLGDTIYQEYEPTADEMARLKAGARVRAKGDLEAARRRIDMSAVSPHTLAAQRAEAAQYAADSRGDVFSSAEAVSIDTALGVMPETPAPVVPTPVALKVAPQKAPKAKAPKAPKAIIKVPDHADSDRVPEDDQ